MTVINKPRTLHDYQATAIRHIYQHWARDERPLLIMPTGAGKSFTAMSLIKQCHEVYKIVLVVRKRGLVQQLVDDAKGFNLPYGVFMAGHKEYDETAPIQICSIDTISARDDYPHADNDKTIVVIDEADESLSPKFCEFLGKYKRAKLLGMTATAYNGLYHFTHVVSPITPKELNEQGILVDYSYIVPECAIDTSDVNIRNGEFVKKELKDKNVKIVGNAVDVWRQFSEYRPTLVFASNVEHSKEIVKRFNEAGIPAAHCDADTSLEERIEVIEKFRAGLLRVISNVNIFCRGTNIIEIGCIIDAAATLIMNRHVQKLGRGSRANPHFKDCICIDMVRNILNLGHFYSDRSHMISLKKPYKLNRTELENQELMRQCTGCFGCYEPSDFKGGLCPGCGKKSSVIRKLKTGKGDFVKISEEEIERQTIVKAYKKLYWQFNNLPYYKNIYRKDKFAIRKAILLKMSKKFGVKVYEVMR